MLYVVMYEYEHENGYRRFRVGLFAWVFGWMRLRGGTCRWWPAARA